MHRSYWHVPAGAANSIIWAPTQSPPSTFPGAGLPWTTRGCLPATGSTPTLPCPQMAAAKWGSRKMQMNLLEMYWAWRFSLPFQFSWQLYSVLKNDTKKPFGLDVGGFLLSRAALLLADEAGNKAAGEVGRMTSHQGQVPGWAPLFFHLGPLNGPRSHLGNTLSPEKAPSSLWN